MRAILNGVLPTFDPHPGSSARRPLVPSEEDHGRLEGVKAHERGGMKWERSITKHAILPSKQNIQPGYMVVQPRRLQFMAIESNISRPQGTF